MSVCYFFVYGGVWVSHFRRPHRRDNKPKSHIIHDMFSSIRFGSDSSGDGTKSNCSCEVFTSPSNSSSSRYDADRILISTRTCRLHSILSPSWVPPRSRNSVCRFASLIISGRHTVRLRPSCKDSESTQNVVIIKTDVFNIAVDEKALILFIILFGTTILPALIFASDYIGSFMAKNTSSVWHPRFS